MTQSSPYIRLNYSGFFPFVHAFHSLQHTPNRTKNFFYCLTFTESSPTVPRSSPLSQSPTATNEASLTASAKATMG